ncbi:MAG: His/Gly/Thr/Pro-type tRNA ligase C-terminal domain-containing protein [Nitrosomonas sp.]|nr:His/Gly/Thr/Pro-type tRNA ligase C-terminal domain-containing protein [Nitrosomonas sp.]MDZ4104618.1 His/Gly/Thr/Pro-type tRNA ligase C-terminal domain-containing protein [Nitrosomonas sp.]
MQAAVLSITVKHSSYAEEVSRTFRRAGIRTEIDIRNEKIGFKIREHTLARVPYLIVVGNNEMANSTVAIRDLGGAQLGSLELSVAVDFLREQLKCEPPKVN